MEEVPLSLIILLIVLLLLSAFFSSAETAYSSVNKIRLKNYVDERRPGAKKAFWISENFDQTLSTILVGNNIVNIAAASISAQLSTQLFGPNLGVFISTFVVTILVLIFGEIMPKSLAKEFAETYSMKISGILHLLIKLLAPVTWVFLKLRKGMSVLTRNKQSNPSVTEEELKVMVDISEQEGVIDYNEKELVHRSLEFDDIIVEEIIKPRTDMVALDVDSSIDEIKETFFKERYSRIPVYEDNIDNIIGILSERDFLTALIRDELTDIRTILREPLFVVESMKISILLPELQRQKTHMAIVIDEFGGTSGLITLEDILEEIVGEIWDEHDESIKLFKQIDSTTYEFSADYPIDDFARYTSVELPDTSYHTLGGWITEEFQRVPIVGEELQYDNVTLRIVEGDEKRLRKVIVVIEPREAVPEMN